jgi:hypothetical protein
MERALPVSRGLVAVIRGSMTFADSGFALLGPAGRAPHGEAPAAFKRGNAACGIAFASLGGYIGGLIAGRRPPARGVGVAVVLAPGASASPMATIGRGAVWSRACAPPLMAPPAVARGWLRPRATRAAVPRGGARSKDAAVSDVPVAEQLDHVLRSDA